MQFPNWQYVESLYEDIGDYLDENCSIYDDFKGHRFDLDRKDFIQILKIILYIMIERIHAYRCCELFNDYYLNHSDVPVSIDNFTCHHGN